MSPKLKNVLKVLLGLALVVGIGLLAWWATQPFYTMNGVAPGSTPDQLQNVKSFEPWNQANPFDTWVLEQEGREYQVEGWKKSNEVNSVCGWSLERDGKVLVTQEDDLEQAMAKMAREPEERRVGGDEVFIRYRLSRWPKRSVTFLFENERMTEMRLEGTVEVLKMLKSEVPKPPWGE